MDISGRRHPSSLRCTPSPKRTTWGWSPCRTPNQPGKDHTVISPDIAFLRAERAVLLHAPGTPDWDAFLPLAPDLAVEVASPSQDRLEMAQKAKLYLAAGTRLLWLVWPKDKQVDRWRRGSDAPAATLGMDDTLEGEKVVPGFTFPVARLFG